MSNARKLKGDRQPLPRCPDCHSRTNRTRTRDGTVVHLAHQRGCPAWGGAVPDPAERYALAEADADPGRTVTYLRALRLPEGQPVHDNATEERRRS